MITSDPQAVLHIRDSNQNTLVMRLRNNSLMSRASDNSVLDTLKASSMLASLFSLFLEIFLLKVGYLISFSSSSSVCGTQMPSASTMVSSYSSRCSLRGMYQGDSVILSQAANISQRGQMRAVKSSDSTLDTMAENSLKQLSIWLENSLLISSTFSFLLDLCSLSSSKDMLRRQPKSTQQARSVSNLTISQKELIIKLMCSKLRQETCLQFSKKLTYIRRIPHMYMLESHRDRYFEMAT